MRRICPDPPVDQASITSSEENGVVAEHVPEVFVEAHARSPAQHARRIGQRAQVIVENVLAGMGSNLEKVSAWLVNFSSLLAVVERRLHESDVHITYYQPRRRGLPVRSGQRRGLWPLR